MESHHFSLFFSSGSTSTKTTSKTKTKTATSTPTTSNTAKGESLVEIEVSRDTIY